MHSYNCDGEYVGCTGANHVVIYAVDGFSCVWPGFARSLFSGENVTFAIVSFIRHIVIDHQQGIELGFEDRDSNNSNPGIEFTLCKAYS